MSTASIVFFISGHGFGHASRQVEIIHAVSALRPDLRILIRSAVNPALLRRTLTVPFELRPGPCDTGIVQTSSIEQDDAATVRDAVEFYGTYGDRIDADVRALAGDRVRLIVGDIAPLAFEVAARMGVPGVAIANFTWDWIYETHPGLTAAAPWLVPLLRGSYRKASLALELPWSGGFDVFATRRPLPLVARRATRTRADTRAHFGLDPDRPIVLLSFGGYGLPHLDLSALDCLDDWTVVTTDRIAAPNAAARGVRLIPEDGIHVSGVRYEDLGGRRRCRADEAGLRHHRRVRAAGTAMLYTSRGAFREYAISGGGDASFLRAVSSRRRTCSPGAGPRAAMRCGATAARESMPADGAASPARELTRVLDASTSG